MIVIKNYFKLMRIFLLFCLTLYFIISAIINIYSDKLYPIEKSSLWESLSAKTPLKENLNNLLRASEINSSEYDYYFLLGKYYLFHENNEYTTKNKMENYKKSQKYLQTALELNPTRIEIMAYLGWMYFALSEFQKGNNYFNKAIKISPNNYFVRAYYAMTIFHFLNRMPQDFQSIYVYRALEEMKIALELNPNLTKSMAITEVLCKISILNKDITSAGKYILYIENISLNNINIFYTLIEYYLKNDDFINTIKIYEDIFKKTNNDDFIIKKTLSHLRKSVSFYNNDIFLTFAAKSFYNYNEYKNALFSVKKALGQNYNMVDNYYLLGLVYEKMDQKKQAYSCFVKVLKYNPRHKEAEQKIIEYQKSMIKMKQ